MAAGSGDKITLANGDKVPIRDKTTSLWTLAREAPWRAWFYRRPCSCRT